MTDTPLKAPSDKSDSDKDKAASTELAALRAQIDEIDNALLGLLAKRQDLSRAIVTKKALGSNVFRPDRELSLLRNLVADHAGIDARLIMGLWRHIISASIAEQKPDYCIAHSAEGKELATNHSAGYMQLAPYGSVADAIDALRARKADCVILTTDEVSENAALLAPDEVVIAASIGFLQLPDQARGYILCRELPLESGDDRIVVRHADNSLTHHDATMTDLANSDIVGRYAAPIMFKTDRG